MPSTTNFDAQCYVSRYPDIKGNKTASKDPYGHWIKFGQAEGRVPGCDIPGTLYSTVFNGNAYLARYADIRQSSYNTHPYDHFLRAGQAEGRHPGYEIIIPGITPALTAGMVSPGTVLIQDANAPAGSDVVTNKDVNSLISDSTDNSHTGDGIDTAAKDVVQTISQNKNTVLYVAAGAAVLLLLTHKKKKR